MKNKYLCVILSILTSLMLRAQSGSTECGTGALAGAEMYALLPGNFTALNNPGYMQNREVLGISIFQELPYGLSDFSKSAIGVYRQMKSKAFGLALLQSGNSYLNEQVISAGWATAISKKLRVGLAIQGHNLHRYQENTARALNALLGLTFDVSQQVTCGITIHNPTRQNYSHVPGQKVPVQYRLQGSYAISKELTWLQGINKCNEDPLIWQFGLQYKPYEKLNLLVGLIPAKGIVSAGVALVYRKTTYSLAFRYSNTLGYWPAAEINYSQP